MFQNVTITTHLYMFKRRCKRYINIIIEKMKNKGSALFIYFEILRKNEKQDSALSIYFEILSVL